MLTAFNFDSKMGNCSCKEESKKLAECEEKLKSYEKLMKAYSDNTENISNMRSSQNNIGFLNFGYDQNTNNEACDCGLVLWGISKSLL